MVTYSPSDKLLIPNDAFGQHIACSNRFDDEIGWDIVKEEAAKYYANIVLPYGDQVQKALQAVKTLDIDMIAPSHGVIWRSYIKEIIDEYEKWSTHQTEPKALIAYDSMWGSTKTIAYTLLNDLEKLGIPTTIRNLSNTHISDVITDVLTSRLIILGSPTLNNTMLPSMGGFLTYLKGLRPKNRIGFVFGSYGWSGQAVGEIEKYLTDLKWELPEKSINLNFIPDEGELKELNKIATKLAQHINK
jgi:flavorubredoxin